MATSVSWETLRELAAFRPERGWALSLYLGMDPRTAPTAGDVATRVSALLSDAEKLVDARAEVLTRDQREAAKRDVERVRRFFADDFDRDGTHGLAIFSASADDVWRPLPLTDPVGDEVKLDLQFYVAPLVPLVGKGDGCIVAAVNRERGDVYRLRGGRLAEIADHSEEAPRRHDQGGWSQARFQRSIDNLAAEHMRRVAEELDSAVRREPATLIVVAPEEIRTEFCDLLAQETRAALAGWATAEAHASPNELLEAVQPVIERRRAERVAEVLERWREAAGREGRAAAGWDETLAAASDGRVDVLLYGEAADRPAYQCQVCGRASATAGDCPLDGVPMDEHAEGLDLAVHRTLAHGGTIQPIGDRRDLEPVGGIAALLRF